MLQKFDITGVHFKVDRALHTYIEQKLRTLDRYVPRRERSVAHMEVRVYEQKAENRMWPVCETVLRLPGETFALTEKGTTIYAAVDIVKAKLKQELSRYRGEYPDGSQRRHLFSRLRGGLTSIIARR